MSAASLRAWAAAQVFMISEDDVLDDALVEKLLATGHSRIPVHAAGDTTKIKSLVLVKEMLLKARVRRRCTPAPLLLYGAYRLSSQSLMSGPFLSGSSDACWFRCSRGAARVQDRTPIGELPMRGLPSLSASMPMYDVLHLFKIGRAHMALLKEATDGAAPPACTTARLACPVVCLCLSPCCGTPASQHGIAPAEQSVRTSAEVKEKARDRLAQADSNETRVLMEHDEVLSARLAHMEESASEPLLPTPRCASRCCLRLALRCLARPGCCPVRCEPEVSALNVTLCAEI
jgi:hypothetical protein